MNLKNKKVKIIILVAIIVLVIIVAICAVIKSGKKKNVEQDINIPTEKVVKQTINNYVSMTGSIEANDSCTVYSTVNGVEVLEVRVEVGDTVKKGDVIAVLDSSDYQDKLVSAKKELEVSKKKTQLQLKKAEEKKERAATDAVDAVTDAQTNLDRAATDYGYTQRTVDEAYADLQDAQEDYDDAKDEYKKVKRLYKEIDSFADDDVTSFVTYKGKNYYKADQGQFFDIREDAKRAKESAEDKLETAERQYKSAKESAEKSYRNYDDAKEKQEDTVKEHSRNMQDADEAYEGDQLDAEVSGKQLEDQIKDYEKQIDKCTILASIDGVVTTVSMEAGDETDTDNNKICVIKDTSKYIVKGTVDEFDIAKIKEGMKAVIQTEATGEEQMAGVVSFVATTPVAASSSSGASSSSSEVNYEINIDIDEMNPNARIGMTAETNILIETAEDVLTVPYECIVKNSAGEDVIYAAVLTGNSGEGNQNADNKNADNKNVGSKKEGAKSKKNIMGGPGMPGRGGRRFDGNADSDSQDMARLLGKEIVVTKGLESDYYTEISGEGVYDGMVVYIPEEDDDSDEFSDAAQSEGSESDEEE